MSTFYRKIGIKQKIFVTRNNIKKNHTVKVDTGNIDRHDECNANVEKHLMELISLAFKSNYLLKRNYQNHFICSD